MNTEEVFLQLAPIELARLERFGFGSIQPDHGPGFTYQSFRVFRDREFIGLVREIRDRLIYCELGHRSVDGSQDEDRVDLRQLLERPSELGSYEETEAGIRSAIRDVTDVVVSTGIKYFSQMA